MSSNIKMDPAMPLSPASTDGQLPAGFEDLVQHNNGTSFPREQGVIETASIHSTSHPASRMATPTPGMSPHVDHNGFSAQYHPHAMYGGTHYSFQPIPGYDSSAYPTLPDDSNQPAYTTPTSSPSQRSVSVPRSSSMRTLASKSRVEKPAPKKKKHAAKGANKVSRVDKPLSELTKDWPEPIIDVDAYVNRSTDVRMKEVETGKNPGKIKRPMNAFMLYRKAYQDRTRQFCAHNNHQIVSQVCGDSWRLEPQLITEQFNEWAKMERANHAKAFPGYKFTPAKPKNLKRKVESDEEEASDLETLQWPGADGRVLKRSRGSNRSTPVPDDVVYAGMPAYYGQAQQYAQYSPVPGMMPPRGPAQQMSRYEFTNPGKPMPQPYNSVPMGQSHYYQPHAMPTRQQHLRGYGVEDVTYYKTPSPANPYHQSPQPGLADSFSSTPQQYVLEQTPPPPGNFFDGHIDTFAGQADTSLLFENSFDLNNPLHLQGNSIEAAINFNSGDQSAHPLGDEFDDFSGDLLQNQQAQDILRGADDSWDIQQIHDGLSNNFGDEFSLDPSLSEVFPAQDPSLSEPYSERFEDLE